MAKSTQPVAPPELKLLTGVVVAALLIGCLYWAQLIFIPVVLAVYLSFLMAPLVGGLQRRGAGRVPAALLVVAMLGLVLGGVLWVVTHELAGLVEELPQYSGNIRKRIHDLQSTSGNGPVHALDQIFKEVSGELDSLPKPAKEEQTPANPPSANPRSTATLPTRSTPIAVEAKPPSPPWIARLPGFLGSMAETLGGLVLTLVLIIFMLLKREDLRNRVIRLFGSHRLTHTTRAVDDATQRVAKYFVLQAIINAGFAVAIFLGLFLIGVRYALLWGLLAGLLRYIPYVGPVLGAIPPLLVSLAMTSGWAAPLLVIGLFVGVELIVGNAVEPRVFGHNLGVSEVALLVMAAVWGFLWGPIGMVLANPLTVCLLVLGKYVPRLEFLAVLLGDEPPLEPDIAFYQRLYARDQDEAQQLVDTHIKANSLEQVYDDLLVPALTLMKRDRERDELNEDDERFMVQAIREIVEELAARRQKESATEAVAPNQPSAPLPKAKILGSPARDAADELALEMLRQVLDPAKWELQITRVEMLSSELVEEVERSEPGLICIASLPAGGLAHTRYLCKRLRSRLPEIRILVGRWGLKSGVDNNYLQLGEAGADEMDTTLLATKARLASWFGFLSHVAPAEQSVGKSVVSHLTAETASQKPEALARQS